MKMDAMQKRRMWKVAIAHFVLTGVIFSALLYLALQEHHIKFEVFGSFWLKMFFLLQPEFLVVKLKADITDRILPPIIWWILVPLWSICFGWLYVKFTNWLNHFPVLGKKVF